MSERGLIRGILVHFALGVSVCGAQPSIHNSESDVPSQLFGIIFDIEASPQIAPLSSYADQGYSASVGFGLNLSAFVQSTVQIYVGMEAFPPGSVKPVDGWRALGGGALEVTGFFTSEGDVRPFATVGYGLYTLGGGGGYNGGGPHLVAGAEWNFSHYFALRGGARYAAINFHDPAGPANQAIGFEPFTARYAGVAIRLIFYPGVFP